MQKTYEIRGIPDGMVLATSVFSLAGRIPAAHARDVQAACPNLQIPTIDRRDFGFRARRVQRYVARAGNAEPFQ